MSPIRVKVDPGGCANCGHPILDHAEGAKSSTTGQVFSPDRCTRAGCPCDEIRVASMKPNPATGDHLAILPLSTDLDRAFHEWREAHLIGAGAPGLTIRSFRIVELRIQKDATSSSYEDVPHIVFV